MKSRRPLIVLGLLALTLPSLAAAQRDGFRFRLDHSPGWQWRDSHFRGSPFFFGSRRPIFSFVEIPREFAPVFVADHFLFSRSARSRVSRHGDRGGFWTSGPGFYYDRGYGAEMEPLYSSRNFVLRWGGLDVPPGGRVTTAVHSTLLTEGMKQEEVMFRLGAPLHRVQLGGREVWKYSGYSLFFEEGLLREIR